jgi:hypothetical protein
LNGRLFIDDEEEIEPGVVKLSKGRLGIGISVKILGLSKLIQLYESLFDISDVSFIERLNRFF